MDLPTGTVTFLFTDIEGSTRLWEEQPEAMGVALARHNAIVQGRIAALNGRVFKTAGDSFCAAFETADDAMEAALEAQRALQAEPWPGGVEIRVRMAVHTGHAIVDQAAGDYFGPALNRVARLLAAGHGGQILLSDAAREHCADRVPGGAALLPLGEHRFKDLGSPVAVFQLCHPELRSDFPSLRSLNSPEWRHNLPCQLTSFIGREQELNEVRQLFGRSRLVTITGAGGMGKSRLALQAAAEMLDEFPHGVWLAEFAALTEAAAVAQTVAGVLEIREEAGKPIIQTVVEQLRSKKLLLILDNCEHLLETCAKLADSILRSDPDVMILATSREGLGISGEAICHALPLSFPDPDLDPTPETLLRFEAGRLFVDRASLVMPGFELTQRNARAVASICHRLDGIPLAIELSAARVRNLSVEEIDKRLDQRFQLLTGGSRAALPRQQTLKALIDWSYELLNESERALLCRLSAFSGGWSLEAAEQVCSGSGIESAEVLDLLSGLSDKSMVVAEPRGEAMRYRLLETVRQYARDRLLESDRADSWHDRHLAFYAEFGRQAEPNLSGAEQQAWLERLDEERGNVNAALQWAEQSDPETGLQLAGWIWRHWYVRGLYAEGRERLESLLRANRQGDQGAARADALTGAGVMAYCQGDYAGARNHFEEGLAIRQGLQDRPGVATLLNNLGNVAYDQGNYDEARNLFEQSLALRMEMGEQRGTAATLNNLGNVANEQGDYVSARRLFQESLALKEQLGDRWGMAHSISNLGQVAYNEGDYRSARELIEESLTIRRELGDRGGIALSLSNLGNVFLIQDDFIAADALFRESLLIKAELGDRWGIAFALEGVAAAKAGMGHIVTAARLWGAAEALREEIGAPIPLNDRKRYQEQVAATRAAVEDEADFERAWKQGRALPIDEAIESALQSPPAQPRLHAPIGTDSHLRTTMIEPDIA